MFSRRKFRTVNQVAAENAFCFFYNPVVIVNAVFYRLNSLPVLCNTADKTFFVSFKECFHRRVHNFNNRLIKFLIKKNIS